METTNTSELTVYATAESAAAVRTNDQRTIKQGFKNPARAAFVNVSNEAWDKLKTANVPDQYSALLDAVLVQAAKSIIKRTVENLSGRVPSTINAAWLTADAILEEATNSNSGMMTKAELEEAWNQSETRRRIMTSERYQQSREYRVAANAYAELILGLTARTPTYTDKQLDTMIAKLDDSDLDTDLGSFILRRVDAIRNKPAKAAIDLDLL